VAPTRHGTLAGSPDASSNAYAVTQTVNSAAVPPPKRKSGGRVTPAGTRPGTAPAGASRSTGERAAAVSASSRYTPPVPQSAKESPPWVPVLMLVLFAVGALAIMLRYLVFSDSNWPMVVGLACLLGGLYTATKWR
jgi:Cell division protein CrgA